MCLTVTSLRDFLQDVFITDDQDISYKQWVNTDPSFLNTITVQINDFFETVCSLLQNLTLLYFKFTS